MSNPSQDDGSFLGQRVRKQTSKGLHYSIERKVKGMVALFSKLKDRVSCIRRMMSDMVSTDEVKESYNEWMQLYDEFLCCYGEYEQYVEQLSTEESRDLTDTGFADRDAFLQNFKTTVESWFEMMTGRVKHKPSEISRGYSRRSSRGSRGSAGSNISRDSKASLRSNVSQAILQEKQLHAELQAQADSLEKKQELEQAKLQLRLQEEHFELSTKIAISNAKSKVLNQYEAELEPRQIGSMHYNSSLVSGKDGSASGLLPIDGTMADPSHNAFTWNADAPVFQPSKDVRLNGHGGKWLHRQSEGQVSNKVKPVSKFLSGSDSNVSHVDDDITVLVRQIKKPAAEIRKFGGDPMQYKLFIRQFNSRVVMYADSDEEKLNYLEQFTFGEANKIVHGFSYLSGVDGYRAVLKEFEDRYGNVEIIANTFIKKAMEWPVIKADQPKVLDEFSVFLMECEYAINSIDAVKVLENPENMKKLIMKLPYYLHDRWRGKVQQIKEKSGFIKFSELSKFVKQEARKATDPIYGRDAMNDLKATCVSKPSGANNMSSRKAAAKSFAANVASKSVDTDITSASSGVGTPAASTTTSAPTNAAWAWGKPCLYCQGDHVVNKCYNWDKLSLKDRINYLKSKGLCFGCIKFGHMKSDCQNKATCGKCKKLHPTILHVDWAKSPKVDSADAKAAQHTVSEVRVTGGDSASKGTSEVCGQTCLPSEGECTLAIIPVRVRMNNSAKVIDTYALMDPGSTVSFCSKSLVDQLCCHGKKVDITLNTMGSTVSFKSQLISGLEVSDMKVNSAVSLPRVYSKESIPVSKRHIPKQRDLRGWPHLEGVDIPEIDGEVTLLIGNNVPDAYSPLELCTGPRGSPHAVKTLLGWIVWNFIRESAVPCSSFAVHKVEVLAVQEHDEQLNHLVQQSINYEFNERTIDDKKEPSVEDRLFTKKVISSMKLTEDGHYEMCLPFRDEHVTFPDNRVYALKRLSHVESKMKKMPQFAVDYCKFMNTMFEKGYAEQVPSEELERNDGKVWYIPHHGIYHPKKPGKIRVVFDCAATYLGVSLNNLLLQGPNLTTSLIDVLLRFRQEPIAVIGDVEGMFLQVRVTKCDCDCLRFLWWPDDDVSNQPIAYRMIVHIFGAVSSPSCANIALQQTAIDNRGKFDDTVYECVFKNFYVDDCLKSVSQESAAIIFVEDLCRLCQMGGFHLTKWLGNNRNVMNAIPDHERAKGFTEINLDRDDFPVERALGLVWVVQADTFAFKIQIPKVRTTRRGILSAVHSLYDPLGLVAPFTLPAKIILQKLCQRGIPWDEEISEDETRCWIKWLDSLSILEDVHVDRCFRFSDMTRSVSIQLHSFADASEKGYGCVIYLRFEDEQGCVHCSLVMGKSRVAPLKRITIPRMELAASTLAVRLSNLVRRQLQYTISEVFFWTDSTAVLQYIANKTTRFHTYVANRLVIIHEGSSVEQWNYIQSEFNPADVASRGLCMEQAEESCRNWFSGPAFLKTQMSSWPENRKFMSAKLDDDNVEVRSAVSAAASEAMQTDVLDVLASRCSTWTKLKNVTAWTLKYFRNLRFWGDYRRKLVGGDLFCSTSSEVQYQISKLKLGSGRKSSDATLDYDAVISAEMVIVRWVQSRAFKMEIAALKSGNHLRVGSRLRKLDPILVNGILRVGGRIERASIPYDAKHPIILPKDSKVSFLVLSSIHKLVGHMGKNAMLSRLRQHFWILRSGMLTKSIVSKCVTCRKYRAEATIQKMADLPKDRVTAEQPPFSQVGMDYFGPFEVKRGRSSVKRYGVIFTCMAIRAVHLEVAYSLDTDSCINAIRRFIARRGTVQLIRSDNGTNMVGAERELRQEYEKMNSTKLHHLLLNEGIKWEFNPPSASHFGGVWERMIRSVRKIMYSLLRDRVHKVDDETLSTVFCEVEAILNDRPITAIRSDPDDFQALTPNSLLQLRETPHLPAGVFEEGNCYMKRRWRVVQSIAQQFWKRWSHEYLQLLQERQKWFEPKRNVTVGDIVLVLDGSMTNSYALGKVVDTIKDGKGLVRTVFIKTSNGASLKRPVHKTCLVLESENFI